MNNDTLFNYAKVILLKDRQDKPIKDSYYIKDTIGNETLQIRDQTVAYLDYDGNLAIDLQQYKKHYATIVAWLYQIGQDEYANQNKDDLTVQLEDELVFTKFE